MMKEQASGSGAAQAAPRFIAGASSHPHARVHATRGLQMRQRGCACARHGDAMRCDAIPAVRARSGQKRQRPPPPASRSRPDVDALPGELRGIALTRPRRPAAHRALTERPFHRPVPAARARERGRTEAERGSGAVCQRRAAGLGSEERTNQTVVARAVGHWGGWRGSWLLHGTSRIGTSPLRNSGAADLLKIACAVAWSLVECKNRLLPPFCIPVQNLRPGRPYGP